MRIGTRIRSRIELDAVRCWEEIGAGSSEKLDLTQATVGVLRQSEWSVADDNNSVDAVPIARDDASLTARRTTCRGLCGHRGLIVSRGAVRSEGVILRASGTDGPMKPLYHRFTSLQRSDRRLVVESALLMALVWVGLRLLPFRTLRHVLDRCAAAPAALGTSQAGVDPIERVHWAITVTGCSISFGDLSGAGACSRRPPPPQGCRL